MQWRIYKLIKGGGEEIIFFLYNINSSKLQYYKRDCKFVV